MKQHPTEELLKILNSLDSVEELEQVASEAEQTAAYSSFSDFLSQKMKASGISTADIIRRTNIQRTYCYQILSGAKNPGRDKVISLCLALTLSLNDVQRALTLAGEASLYPKRRRDSILIFCINQEYSVTETNNLLFDLNEEILH